MKYQQLQKVSINPYTKMSKNETVSFEEIDGNMFKITKGATDCKHGRNKERELKYPIEEWDERLGYYLDNGFTVIDDVKRGTKEVVTDGEYAPIKDKGFKPVLENFIRLNNEFFEENYSKNIKDVSKANIDIVQKTIVELSKDIKTVSVSDFNDALMSTIWTYVPRRMNHLDRHIAHSKDDFEKIIGREQDMLDALVQELQSGQSADKKLDILAANGLTERWISPEEKDFIKSLMGDQTSHFSRAWAVTNEACEKAMNDYLTSEGFDVSDPKNPKSGISYLWHGTPESNFWSIMKSGLYLNPALIKSGVRICGKAYGYGSYFAPYVYKSMGYAGANFSYNRDLGGRTAYIFLFKVATGNPYYIYSDKDKPNMRPNHWEDFHENHPKQHCCWAECGGGALGNTADYRLRYDEVIVYQQCQSSLAYIVELKP